MIRPTYLDYMATTPVDDRVISEMINCLGKDGVFGNSSSMSHYYGFQARERIECARQQVADSLLVDPREIIWTSGATEANNLAIKGAVYFYQRQGKHIITMTTEHKSVLDTCRFLETQGFEVSYLQPEKSGILDLNKLEKIIRRDTLLISIMHVNNETGVIQDIASIGRIAKQHGIKFHVDATQSVGKTSLNLSELDVDLMSFSAHKAYGPKGIGALYMRHKPKIRLQPLLHGGSHEQGFRSGTLATHQIVGIGKAFELATKELNINLEKIKNLHTRFWQGLSNLNGIYINGFDAPRIPHCLNIRFDGIDGEALLVSLRDIAISSGSACNSANPEPSHVLMALGLNRQQADSSLRFSLGCFTSEQEIDKAVSHIVEQVNYLRSISPLWKQ